MNEFRIASVALAFVGWLISGQAQSGRKPNYPAGCFEGTATSQQEGAICDNGHYAAELVTPTGTYTVEDGHF